MGNNMNVTNKEPGKAGRPKNPVTKKKLPHITVLPETFECLHTSREIGQSLGAVLDSVFQRRRVTAFDTTGKQVVDIEFRGPRLTGIELAEKLSVLYGSAKLHVYRRTMAGSSWETDYSA